MHHRGKIFRKGGQFAGIYIFEQNVNFVQFRGDIYRFLHRCTRKTRFGVMHACLLMEVKILHTCQKMI